MRCWEPNRALRCSRTGRCGRARGWRARGEFRRSGAACEQRQVSRRAKKDEWPLFANPEAATASGGPVTGSHAGERGGRSDGKRARWVVLGRGGGGGIGLFKSRDRISTKVRGCGRHRNTRLRSTRSGMRWGGWEGGGGPDGQHDRALARWHHASTPCAPLVLVLHCQKICERVAK